MLEAGLSNPTPAGDGVAGQQDTPLGLDDMQPPWSHTWFDRPPRERSRRMVRRYSQNGRAGPSMPRGRSPIDGDDSSDDEVHVPYRQVSVAFVSRGSGPRPVSRRFARQLLTFNTGLVIRQEHISPGQVRESHDDSSLSDSRILIHLERQKDWPQATRTTRQ
jgi:hypothetical protein